MPDEPTPDPDVRARQTSNLKPIRDPERARELGRKGGEARARKLKEAGRLNWSERRDIARSEASAARELVAAFRESGIKVALSDRTLDEHPDIIAKLCRTGAVQILARIVGGDPALAPKNLGEATRAAALMNTILRLEEGRPTELTAAIHAHGQLPAEKVQAKVQGRAALLRARLAEQSIEAASTDATS